MHRVVLDDIMFVFMSLGILFMLGVMVAVGVEAMQGEPELSSRARVTSIETVAGTLHNIELYDGTKCVALNDSAIHCDWSIHRPVYGDK